MTDIESRLRDALHADAGEVVVPPDLSSGAIARAGRIRRRRRVAVAAAVAVLVALAAVPLMRPARTPDRAAAIGADPGLLHFDVDAGALGGEVLRVIAGRDYETVVVYRRLPEVPYPQTAVSVHLATSPGALRSAVAYAESNSVRWKLLEKPRSVAVAGVPGTVERQQPDVGKGARWVVRWEPRPGLLAMLTAVGGDQAGAIAAVRTVQLDRTRRCVLPFRVADAPRDVRQVTCDVLFQGRDADSVMASAEWQPDDGSLALRVTAATKTRDDLRGESTVDGKDALWAKDLDRAVPGKEASALIFPDLRGLRVSVSGIDRTKILDLAREVIVADNPADPSTWPR